MKKIIISIAIVLFSLSVVGGTGAQTSYGATATSTDTGTTAGTAQYTLLTPLPCIPGSGQPCSAGSVVEKVTIQQYVGYIFRLAIAIAVFLAVVVTTFAGFKYMTEESITGKGEARKMINNAVLGLLGALGSWLILYTINPQLVDLSLITAPKLQLTASSTILSQAALQSNMDAQSAALRQSGNDLITQNAAAVTAQLAAQNTIDNLKKSLDDEACLDDNGNNIGLGDPVCDDLWAKYQDAYDALGNLGSQRVAIKAVASINAAQAAFETAHYETTYNLSDPSQLVGGTNVDDAKKAVQNIDTIYSQTYSTLSNNDAASKSLLTAQRTYSEATIVNDYLTNVAIQKLTDAPGTTQFPVATAAANTLIQQLQSYSIPNQTNSNGIITQPVGTLDSQPALQVSYQQLNDAKIKALQEAIANAKTKNTAYTQR